MCACMSRKLPRGGSSTVKEGEGVVGEVTCGVGAFRFSTDAKSDMSSQQSTRGGSSRTAGKGTMKSTLSDAPSTASPSAGKDLSEIHMSSPTSAVTIPLTPVLKSRIDTLSDQGTEVTLLDWLVRPQRCFADECVDEEEDEDDSHSLVPFEEASLTPPAKMASSLYEGVLVASPDTPFKIPLCGLEGACWKQADALSAVRGQDACVALPVQEYIVAFLGNTEEAAAPVAGWQSLFSSVLDDEVENKDENERKAFQQNILLKRHPHQMKAQRSHLDDLRRNLHPFGAASPKRRTVDLFRSSSHCIQSARKAKPKRRAPLQEIPVTAAKVSLWQALACHQGDAQNVLDDALVPEEVGYDSDPECFGRTPSVRSPARTEKTSSERRLFALDVMGDGENLNDAAKSIMNEKWTLILHVPNERPQAMQVWLERGQRLSKKILQPKLAWKPLPKKGDRILERVSASSIDILDVQRILAIDDIDRERYPLAKGGHSFIVKTINASYCWQAPSKAECERLVALWKLTVARFGAMIVTCDDEGMESYFAPLDAGVGGRRRY